MERTESTENHGNPDLGCSYHVHDYDDSDRSVYWYIAIHAYSAAAGLNGNRYATFHQLGKEQAQKLHEDDRLYDVGDTIFIGSTPLGNSSLSLYLREYHDNALSMYRQSET